MFFGDTLNARIHVDLLVEVELRKELRLDCCIVPSEVILRVELQSSLPFLVDRANIVLLRADQPPFKLLVSRLLDDFVPRARNVDHYFPI